MQLCTSARMQLCTYCVCNLVQLSATPNFARYRQLLFLSIFKTNFSSVVHKTMMMMKTLMYCLIYFQDILLIIALLMPKSSLSQSFTVEK